MSAKHGKKRKPVYMGAYVITKIREAGLAVRSIIYFKGNRMKA
jgi:hypothetical protein